MVRGKKIKPKHDQVELTFTTKIWVDAEIARVVSWLNRQEGIVTTHSCQGKGSGPYVLFALTQGRALPLLLKRLRLAPLLSWANTSTNEDESISLETFVSNRPRGDEADPGPVVLLYRLRFKSLAVVSALMARLDVEDLTRAVGQEPIFVSAQILAMVVDALGPRYVLGSGQATATYFEVDFGPVPLQRFVGRIIDRSWVLSHFHAESGPVLRRQAVIGTESTPAQVRDATMELIQTPLR